VYASYGASYVRVQVRVVGAPATKTGKSMEVTIPSRKPLLPRLTWMLRPEGSVMSFGIQPPEPEGTFICIAAVVPGVHDDVPYVHRGYGPVE
jgi:hypothetical protein